MRSEFVRSCGIKSARYSCACAGDVDISDQPDSTAILNAFLASATEALSARFDRETICTLVSTNNASLEFLPEDTGPSPPGRLSRCIG